jgi:hypothetical protein
MPTPSKWIKLASPTVALNGPNVWHRFIMKYSPVIPWDWSAHRILSEAVPRGVRHLVFNCHGHAWRKEFPTPHLAIGTAIHPGNVGAFDALMPIRELRVIWIASCTIASSQAGQDFCKEMAKRSGCYVMAYNYECPDAAVRSEHIEVFPDASPVFFDPWSELVEQAAFFAAGKELGFRMVS